MPFWYGDVLSGTQISAVVPAEGLGSVDVQVTTPGGTTTITAADKFLYSVPPTVTAQPGGKTIDAGGSTSDRRVHVAATETTRLAQTIATAVAGRLTASSEVTR